MPKHKKTRAQKMKADERRSSLSLSGVSHPTYTFSFPSVHSSEQPSVALATEQLVRHDLLKTAIVSFIILILQIILYVLLKNHVLAINFVRY